MDFLQYKLADSESVAASEHSKLNGFQFTNNFSSPPLPPPPPDLKLQLKITENNEIYITNEDGSFCQLAGNFLKPNVVEPVVQVPKPQELFYIKNGDKKPVVPSSQINSGIFRSTEQINRVAFSAESDETNVVISKSLNNGLIMPKKYLVTAEEKEEEEMIPKSNSKKRKSGHLDKKTDHNLNHFYETNGRQSSPIPFPPHAEEEKSEELNFRNYHQSKMNKKFTVKIHKSSPIEAVSKSTSLVPELQIITGLILGQNSTGQISLVNTNDVGNTVIYQNSDTSKNVVYSILDPNSLNLNMNGTKTTNVDNHKPKVLRKLGRKKGTLTRREQPEMVDVQEPLQKTRSGRLSKPPKHVNKFFHNIKSSNKPEEGFNLNNSFSPSNIQQPSQNIPDENKKKKNIPTQYICSTCNKIYLGKSRMAKHLQQFPDHNKGQAEEGDEKSTYLYKHLLELLHKIKEKDKGRILLREISQFMERIKELIPKLITNEEQNSTIEFLDSNIAAMLHLNHGKYRLNLSHLNEDYEDLIGSLPSNGFNFNMDDGLVQNCHNFNCNINKSFGLLSPPLNLY